MIKRVLRHSSYLILGQLIIKATSFFYSIFLANSIGVSEFGLYAVALSYFAIISSISDFGVSRYLIREVAKDEESGSRIISNVILVRTASVLMMFLLFATGLYLFDSNPQRVDLTLLAILAVIPQSVALTLDSLFVAIQKISYSAIGSVVLNIFTVIFGFVFISFGLNSYGAVLAVTLGQVCYAIFMLALSSTLPGKSWFRSSDGISFVLIRKILAGSLPYGVLGIIGLISFKIDSLMLSYYVGNFETGIYAAGYKFLEAVTFIPGAVAISLFPVVAKMFIADPVKIKSVYLKSLLIMFISGVFISLGFIFVLPSLISMLLPKYSGSIEVVKILAFSVPFIFLHVPSAQVLLSTDEYFKKLLTVYLGLFGINLAVYAYAIPKYGFVGASWATVLSEIMTFVVFFGFIYFKVFGRYNK